MTLQYKPPVRKSVQMWQSQKWKCIYCNHSMILDSRDRHPTLEHITPKSHWGKNDSDNLALACKKCNQYRGNIDIDLFLQWCIAWCQHSQDGVTPSKMVAKPFRWPKKWYHGNLIKW